MKNRSLFFSICILLSSAIYSHLNAAKEKGNGNIITKEIQVSEFNGISLGAGIECSSRSFDKKSYKSPVFNYIQTKGNSSLQVTMDENLFSYLVVNSSNGRLSIGTKKGTTINPSRMQINGSSKYLEKVSVTGCIDFFVENDYSSEQLEILISGASDVKINHSAKINYFNIRISGAGDLIADDLTCKEIKGNVSGAGDITLKGEADKANFTVTGAGDIKAFDFIVNDMECKVSGSGDLKVNASGTLNASVSGTGDIQYKGNATVNTRVTGFGDIKKVN